MVTKIIILIALTLIFLYELTLKILNIRFSKESLPVEVQDIYDFDNYLRWQQYQKDKTKFSIISSSINYVVLMILFGFDILVKYVNILPENVYVNTILVLLSYILLNTIISIPFSYYDQMVIEERYGFNKTTKKTFVIDLIKGLVLEIFITIGLMMLFVLLYQTLGNWILLVFTGIVIIIVLIIFLISPKLVKIYNKCDPLDEGSLKERLKDLLSSAGYEVKEICVIDGSRRSTKANAFFVGLGKSKKIMLYDTLLNQMTEDEIIAVFAHEVGHGIHKDTTKGYLSSLLMIVIMVMLGWVMVTYQDIIVSLGLNNFSYGLAFIVYLEVVITFISPIINLFSNYFSRKHEYAADYYAKKRGYGVDLIKALKILSRNSLSNLNPHPLVIKLEYSHPSVSQRIRALEENKQI